MSPKLERVTTYFSNGHLKEKRELIADIPDQSGSYETGQGKLWVISSDIHPMKNPEITIFAEVIKGKPGRTTEAGARTIQLSRDGSGSQTLSCTERLEVTLQQSIKVTDAKRGVMAEFYPDYPELSWVAAGYKSRKMNYDKLRKMRICNHRRT